jgi:hypothetical protein
VVLKVVIVLRDLQASRVTRSGLGDRFHRFHFFQKVNFVELGVLRPYRTYVQGCAARWMGCARLHRGFTRPYKTCTAKRLRECAARCVGCRAAINVDIQ